MASFSFLLLHFSAGKSDKRATLVQIYTDDYCSPPEAYWTLSIAPQACIDETKHLLAAGCINTITDFLIVLVPIPYVRRLKLPRKQQIIVASLFAGGIFVTAAGAVRTAVTFVLFSDPNKDLTWNSIPVIITSALELYIGIVSAPWSIPAECCLRMLAFAYTHHHVLKWFRYVLRFRLLNLFSLAICPISSAIPSPGSRDRHRVVPRPGPARKKDWSQISGSSRPIETPSTTIKILNPRR